MPPSIGEVIRRLRRDLGFSQDDVARLSNGQITKNWLASLEIGRVKYSNPEKLAIVAKVLRSSVGAIYQEAGLDVPESNPGPHEELDRLIQEIIDLMKPMPDEIKIAYIEFIKRTYSRPPEPAEKKKDEVDVVRR